MKKPLILLSVAFAVFFSLLAHAQNYPAKPIRFVLSYPPGGATDTLGRIVAKTLSDAWGVNVIADNRPGASGNIGTALCAKAPPDGYTMCMVAPAQAIASRLSPNTGYDSLKDFSHVTLVATVPMLLLVHPALPVKNLAELIALAKRRPGALNYASSGGGARTSALVPTHPRRVVRPLWYRRSGRRILPGCRARAPAERDPSRRASSKQRFACHLRRPGRCRGPRS